MAPLPKWRHLFQVLFNRKESQKNLAQPWKNEGEIAGWLSRSAWSMALILQWRRKVFNKSKCIVWIPDYFCNASLVPLRLSGATLVFYPITEEMTPDHNKCKELAKITSPDIFLFVHYFGKPSSSQSINDFCISHNTWLIEDAAHILKPIKGVGKLGDFILYSPHKHLPIHDGALLIVRKSGPSKFGNEIIPITDLPETWPLQLKQLQVKAGEIVKSVEIQSFIWMIKRILQKFKINNLSNELLPFSESDKQFEALSDIVSPNQSSLSRKMLSIVSLELNGIARKRQRSQLLLDELVHSHYAVSPTIRPFKRDWIPYLSSYNVAFQDSNNIYKYFGKKLGLPVTNWPDLAPEVINDDKGVHSNAWTLRHRLFFLPVHQSISHSDLIKKAQKKLTKNINDKIVKVEWQNVSESSWDKYISQSERSNILQSWGYGESKSAIEKWDVRRGVFFKGGEPIAIVQLLQKRFFKTVVLNRINRGPLPLRELTSLETRAIYKELGRLGNIFKARVLFFAPQNALSGENILLMNQLGFRQTKNHPWESIWMDLSIESNLLRKNLDGKWRNMLNFSEKAGLEPIFGTDQKIFDWLMEEHERDMAEKKFSGISVNLLSNLRSRGLNNSNLIVHKVSKDEEPIAGICIAVHGIAATYLVGWNGKQGRALKANQFLLWNAIEELKKRGVKHFDLGGINSDDTPSITAFKLGLSGEPYELVGEYIKW